MAQKVIKTEIFTANLSVMQVLIYLLCMCIFREFPMEKFYRLVHPFSVAGKGPGREGAYWDVLVSSGTIIKCSWFFFKSRRNLKYFRKKSISKFYRLAQTWAEAGRSRSREEGRRILRCLSLTPGGSWALHWCHNHHYCNTTTDHFYSLLFYSVWCSC